MESELLPNLFQPFSQGISGLDRVNGGLGLGLALVKALVTLHDGKVAAHSDGPGRGAEFTIRLPLAALAELGEPPPASLPRDGNGNRHAAQPARARRRGQSRFRCDPARSAGARRVRRCAGALGTRWFASRCVVQARRRALRRRLTWARRLRGRPPPPRRSERSLRHPDCAHGLRLRCRQRTRAFRRLRSAPSETAQGVAASPRRSRSSPARRNSHARGSRLRRS